MLVSPSRVICPSSKGRRSYVGLVRGLLRCRVASSIDVCFDFPLYVALTEEGG